MVALEYYEPDTCAVSDFHPLLPDLSSHCLRIPGISSSLLLFLTRSRNEHLEKDPCRNMCRGHPLALVVRGGLRPHGTNIPTSACADRAAPWQRCATMDRAAAAAAMCDDGRKSRGCCRGQSVAGYWYVYVCLCVCVCVCVCLCACASECEREREKVCETERSCAAHRYNQLFLCQCLNLYLCFFVYLCL